MLSLDSYLEFLYMDVVSYTFVHITVASNKATEGPILIYLYIRTHYKHIHSILALLWRRSSDHANKRRAQQLS